MDNQKSKAALINTIKSQIHNHYPDFDVVFSDDKLSTFVTDHIVIMPCSADSESDSESEFRWSQTDYVIDVIKVRIKKEKTTDAAKQWRV